MTKPRITFSYSDDDVSSIVAKFNDFLQVMGYLDRVSVINNKPCSGNPDKADCYTSTNIIYP